MYFYRGVLPYEQRKKLLEKARARARRNRTTFTSCIVRGVQVCNVMVYFVSKLMYEMYERFPVKKQTNKQSNISDLLKSIILLLTNLCKKFYLLHAC